MTTENADCSNIAALVTPNTAWDSNRSNLDPTGFYKKLLDQMPRPNSFDGGDGLNTAIFSWSRPRHGNDEISGGTQDTTDRGQINIRLDHNFSTRHKLAVNWSYEKDSVDNNGPDWPTGFWGSVYRWPQVWTSSFTSTLSATMVNEARWGLRRNKAQSYEAMDDPRTGKAAREFYPKINGLPVFVNPSLFGASMLS